MSTVALSSEVRVRILPNGKAEIAAAADTYPGSKFYVLVGGKRLSGKSDRYLPLSAAQVASLEREEPFAYTYTNWPYGSEISGEDAIAGFATARAKCVEFLGG